MWLRNYGLRKAWLNKSLKILVSENPSTNNMLRQTNHCSHLNGTTFIIFIDYCEGNPVGENLS